MKIKKKNGTKYAMGGFIGGAVQAAAGVGQVIYGAKQLKKANTAMDQLLSEAPNLDLPSAYNQAAQRALSQTSLNAQTQAINRRLATSTGALGAAGGRALLGGLQSQVTGANQAQLSAQVNQNQRETQALGALGQAQQQNSLLKENRFKMQYGAAASSKDAALQNIGAGVGAAAGGVMQAGMNYEKGMFKKKAHGGSIVAGSGGKTSGKFDHKGNPIDLVQNGEKIGEATGNEFILNPKQAEAIKKQSKFFRDLLKTKRFK